MGKIGASKREKVRVKFGNRLPKVSYRLTHQLDTIEVELLDISETGFAFKINEDDQVTRVGDIIFVSFDNLNDGMAKEFTARIKRFQETEEGLVFAAEFMSVTDKFKQKISTWAKVYTKTGYFLVERRSPASIVFRATLMPIDWINLLYDELSWKLKNFNQMQILNHSVESIASRNLTGCIDFKQI